MLYSTYAHTCTYLDVCYELRSHYKITWKYAEHEHLYGVKQKCYIYICYDYVKNAKKAKKCIYLQEYVGYATSLHGYRFKFISWSAKSTCFLLLKKKNHTHSHTWGAIPKAMNKLKIIIKSLNYNHSNTPSISSSEANLHRSVMHCVRWRHINE